MKTRSGLALVSILVLSACAHHRQHSGGDIIIDTKHVDMGAYYQDLHECRSYAAQVNVGEKVATKAVTGAVVGGAIGAIVGDSSSAARAAGVGGVLGAVKGTGQGYREKQRVVRNCLRGRGYRVLN
jgi:outer membrane lipoprotein SlyB